MELENDTSSKTFSLKMSVELINVCIFRLVKFSMHIAYCMYSMYFYVLNSWYVSYTRRMILYWSK